MAINEDYYKKIKDVYFNSIHYLLTKEGKVVNDKDMIIDFIVESGLRIEYNDGEKWNCDGNISLNTIINQIIERDMDEYINDKYFLDKMIDKYSFKLNDKIIGCVLDKTEYINDLDFITNVFNSNKVDYGCKMLLLDKLDLVNNKDKLTYLISSNNNFQFERIINENDDLKNDYKLALDLLNTQYSYLYKKFELEYNNENKSLDNFFYNKVKYMTYIHYKDKASFFNDEIRKLKNDNKTFDDLKSALEEKLIKVYVSDIKGKLSNLTESPNELKTAKKMKI